jgi:hypothetical protein
LRCPVLCECNREHRVRACYCKADLLGTDQHAPNRFWTNWFWQFYQKKEPSIKVSTDSVNERSSINDPKKNATPTESRIGDLKENNEGGLAYHEYAGPFSYELPKAPALQFSIFLLCIESCCM